MVQMVGANCGRILSLVAVFFSTQFLCPRMTPNEAPKLERPFAYSLPNA
jgi:hypothetical protein